MICRKKHISVFLLFAFNWALLPGVFLHDFFADHYDTACVIACDGKSRVETAHTHCDIFEVNTPVYNIPELVVFREPITILLREVRAKRPGSYVSANIIEVSSRGPPIL